MTHIITSLCLRDGACVEVCPVECIIAGKPEDKWPWYFIDPDTCIDCGACIPECPYEAIFPEDEVPEAHTMKADQERIPFGGARYKAAGGEVVNLRDDIQPNYKFFKEGPGYKAKDM
jgi:NAD-dependent dihydropyrimidine dehydrogenase PreA subunit